MSLPVVSAYTCISNAAVRTLIRDPCWVSSSYKWPLSRLFCFGYPLSCPAAGSELVQKYVGEGARMVRELFQMARSKKACIIFFDEVGAAGVRTVRSVVRGFKRPLLFSF